MVLRPGLKGGEREIAALSSGKLYRIALIFQFSRYGVAMVSLNDNISIFNRTAAAAAIFKL